MYRARHSKCPTQGPGFPRSSRKKSSLPAVRERPEAQAWDWPSANNSPTTWERNFYSRIPAKKALPSSYEFRSVSSGRILLQRNMVDKFPVALLAICVVLTLTAASAGSSEWRFSSPQPHGNNILAMGFDRGVVWQI